MYKLVTIERLGNSVFKSELEFTDINEAKMKFNKEKSNANIVDIRLWYCVEVERFSRNNDKKKNDYR